MAIQGAEASNIRHKW